MKIESVKFQKAFEHDLYSFRSPPYKEVSVFFSEKIRPEGYH